MAIPVIMPKQGNTVESCLILQWHKAIGDQIAEGDVLCEVETDKAVLEVASPVSGTLLETFFQLGDEVPVLTNIAVIGDPGEDVSQFQPAGSLSAEVVDTLSLEVKKDGKTMIRDSSQSAIEFEQQTSPSEPLAYSQVFISPRAKNLAADKNVDIRQLQGSGPGGRIIERDIQGYLEKKTPISPLAKSMIETGDFVPPPAGSGLRGRIMSRDLVPGTADHETRRDITPPSDEVETIFLQGVRRLIADRMLSSLQTTAQLTFNTSADATALLGFRKRLKQSPENLGLHNVTINDLILFVVTRTLVQFPDLNALYDGDTVYRYKNVHLAVAVDTLRGLIVPVIRMANTLSLKELSKEASRLADACIKGGVLPDELTGGTFTVTNLGSLGIESFTPILNSPQVGILGVGNINLKPVEQDGEVTFIPHLGLSLTINHQVVDGAPAARFLQALCLGIAELELLLAL